MWCHRKFYQKEKMKRKAGLLVLAILGVGLCLSGALAQPQELTLPDNLEIETPPAGVSPRLAQLSGIWEGSWNYVAPPAGGGGQKVFPMDVIGRGVKIAIVKITPSDVKAIYARPGKSFQIKEASVAGDTILLRWGKPGEKKTLTLIPTNNPQVANAKLEFEGMGRTLTAKLRKK
jgi:hypothetical protein